MEMVELQSTTEYMYIFIEKFTWQFDFDLSNCSDACIFVVDFSAKGGGPLLKFSFPARNWSSSVFISAFDPVLKRAHYKVHAMSHVTIY